MVATLNTVTTQLIQHDPQIYGGDDVILNNIRSSEGLLGRLVTWERDTASSCCPSAAKAWVLFFVEKLFAFLDWTTIGHRICDEGLHSALQEVKRSYTLRQTIPEQNRVAREQVIDALGGPDACRDIPIAWLRNADLQPNLSVSDDYFPQGHWMVQGEDPSGRKFVALRVQLREIQTTTRDGVVDIQRDIQTTHIITIHQIYRETAAHGNAWRTNFVLNDPVHKDLSHTNVPNLLIEGPAGEPVQPAGINLRHSIRQLREAGSTRIETRHPTHLFGPILPWEAFTFDRAPKP